ncbi:hypothetical protein [Flavobacterium rhizosphaerae]|uniref:LTXXQ motif family protein n=1 Tax=Flavobacterium rhizosphaerae TaxID=3163298 RepID=A0ABW8YY17_9FLAO
MRKNILYKIAALLIFMGSLSAFSQVDRSIGSSQYKPGKHKKRDKKDYIEEAAKQLQKDLSLDDFQLAAVKAVLEDERDHLMSLSTNRDISEAERNDKAREISDRIYVKILPLLNDEQAKKYTKMEEERKKKM